MNIAEAIAKDKEIQNLKIKYKELYGKNAPPYTIGEHAGIDDYKEMLLQYIEAYGIVQ